MRPDRPPRPASPRSGRSRRVGRRRPAATRSARCAGPPRQTRPAPATTLRSPQGPVRPRGGSRLAPLLPSSCSTSEGSFVFLVRKVSARPWLRQERLFGLYWTHAQGHRRTSRGPPRPDPAGRLEMLCPQGIPRHVDGRRDRRGGPVGRRGLPVLPVQGRDHRGRRRRGVRRASRNDCSRSSPGPAPEPGRDRRFPGRAAGPGPRRGPRPICSRCCCRSGPRRRATRRSTRWRARCSTNCGPCWARPCTGGWTRATTCRVHPDQLAPVMMSLVQGMVMQQAIDGQPPFDDYRATVRALFEIGPVGRRRGRVLLPDDRLRIRREFGGRVHRPRRTLAGEHPAACTAPPMATYSPGVGTTTGTPNSCAATAAPPG